MATPRWKDQERVAQAIARQRFGRPLRALTDLEWWECQTAALFVLTEPVIPRRLAGDQEQAKEQPVG